MSTIEINPELEPEILTDKEETKVLPCRGCGRACTVTRFASPLKTECSVCRGTSAAGAEQFEFDDSLETEVLTDKEQTKELPCRQCHRRCVVTMFKSPATTLCLTCGGQKRQERQREVQVRAAHTVDPAKLEDLFDGLINPSFRTVPFCPFDPAHSVELKSISHSPNYGPRHLLGYDGKGMPVYDQQTGESVVYQCNDCLVVVSYSTMHPIRLKAQNEPRDSNGSGPSLLAITLGER